MDGEARRKSSVAGMQGVLCNTSGVVLVFIATVIDFKDSNEAKIWATIEALKIFNTSSLGPLSGK